MKTIKIFLGSSITELHDERILLGDFLMNSVRPVLKKDKVEIEVVKCEDIHSGNLGPRSQSQINERLKTCDMSLFMFKSKAGDNTIREFNMARELQSSKRHEIYIFCFDTVDNSKDASLTAFQNRLENEGLYWKTCKDVAHLESQFIIGLLTYERQLLGKAEPSVMEQESETEKSGDTLFDDFMRDEEKRSQRIDIIHQNIESLLQQTKTVMANEAETIADQIFKAIELYKKADQWAKATDYNKEKYSHLLFDYAQFLNKYGLYKDAETVYLRQIEFAEELYGKEHEQTAKSYNNIGAVYDSLGDYKKALEYYFKALAIWEEVLGKEHRVTATSYNNIGSVYNNLDDYDKALEYYSKALAIREIVLGTEHPKTATSYNNIGEVYRKQGDYDKALEHFLKALAIKKKVLGTEHPSTAASYFCLGAVYYDLGKYKTALKYLSDAQKIYEKELGPDHPYTKNVKSWIVSVNKEMKSTPDN